MDLPVQRRALKMKTPIPPTNATRKRVTILQAEYSTFENERVFPNTTSVRKVLTVHKEKLKPGQRSVVKRCWLWRLLQTENTKFIITWVPYIFEALEWENYFPLTNNNGTERSLCHFLLQTFPFFSVYYITKRSKRVVRPWLPNYNHQTPISHTILQ